MLVEIHDAIIEYSKSLKNVIDLNYGVTTLTSLSQGIIAFRNDILNQYNYNIEFICSIKEELIDPLKQLHLDQQKMGSSLNSNIKQLEKSLQDDIDNMEKLRAKYHNSAKNAEFTKLECEKKKLTNNREINAKIESKFQLALRLAKENEKLYLYSINDANKKRELYIESMKKTLNEFQKLEENYSNLIKDSLRKYLVFQVAFNRNLQYDIEKKANIMESINPYEDLRIFIQKNSTNSLPLPKFEFIPYISEIPNADTLSSNSDKGIMLLT